MKKCRRIELFAFGGTISMTADEGAGINPRLTGSALVDALGAQLPGDITVAAQSMRTVASANLTFADIKDLLERINASDADAFIVTQGTDTLEETCFLTRLFYNGSKPIVFTGAMRAATALAADGFRNIFDACIAATDAKAPPVSLVMNSEIHDPVYVRKTHTSNLNAFKSDHGMLGQIVEDGVFWSRAAFDLPVYDLPDTNELPHIGYVTALFDAPIFMLDGLERFDGLIVDGLGAGHVNEIWSDRLAELAEKMPVLLATRTKAGRVHINTYGYKGGEIDLIRRGLETLGPLDGVKGRLLLSVIMLDQKSDWRQNLHKIIAKL